jgi:glycosyltransferase involved in cell wall biosynthesis
VSARILYIMSGRPWPCDRGDRIRNYHLLQALIPGNEVTLLTLDAESVADLPDGLADCRHVSLGTPLWQQAVAALAFPHLPITAARRSGWMVERRMRSTVCRSEWDVVVGAQLRSVPAALAVGGVPHVLDLTDSLWNLHSQSSSTSYTALRLNSDRAKAEKAREYESFALSQAELVTVASRADAEILQTLLGRARVRVIPNGTNIVSCSIDRASEHGILFVGNCRYRPNLEGLMWFVRDVWPLVRAGQPSCTLDVVGSLQGRVFSILAGIPGVRVHGHVPEIGPYLLKAAVVINPVLTGSGTSLKTLEALAWGKALVTTPAGARSLDLVDAVHCVLASTEAEFATAIRRCLLDPGLRSSLGTAARRVVSERLSWSTVTEQWRGLVLGIAAGVEPQEIP